MEQEKYLLIGIDPDIHKSGFSMWNKSSMRFVSLDALTFLEIMEYLKKEEFYKSRTKIFIEAGWLNKKSNYHPAQGERRREKITKNIGQNHGYGMALRDYLKGMGYDVIEVKPTQRKVDFEYFNKTLTQNKYLPYFEGKMTYKQEIIDSAMLVYGK